MTNKKSKKKKTKSKTKSVKDLVKKEYTKEEKVRLANYLERVKRKPKNLKASEANQANQR